MRKEYAALRTLRIGDGYEGMSEVAVMRVRVRGDKVTVGDDAFRRGLMMFAVGGG